MHFLQNIQNSINFSNFYIITQITNKLTNLSNINLMANFPDDPGARGIPCDDPFVQLMSGGLGFFLGTLMQIGGIIGLICIILCGLLRISALTTQKKEDKDERMFLSKFAFICAIIFLIPTLIFFILLVLLPHWYGLGDTTCH